MGAPEWPTAVVPEVTPPRFDVTDVDGIGDHLAAEGFAVVKAAATATELDRARSLLWQHLEGRDDGSAGALLGSVGVGPNRRPQGRPTGWLRSDPTTWRVGHNDGLLTSSTHSDCLWYVRTRPGVVGGFAAAYACGSDEVLASYDRMSINLPTSSGNAGSLARAKKRFAHGKLNFNQLHTHAQHRTGYCDEPQLICCESECFLASFCVRVCDRSAAP